MSKVNREPMKNKCRLLTFVLFTLFMILVIHGCYKAEEPVLNENSSIDIGDYVFCVEEAVGDRYNVRVLYSLKRQDGKDIAPEARFESFVISGGSQNFGGTTTYTLSENGKIIWIEEVRSSSQKLDSNDVYTVDLENLTFGEDSTLEPIKGKWSVTYRIQINEDYTELITKKLKLQETDDNYYLLSSIQLTNMGIHMEMEVQENNIEKLADHFVVYVIMEDGTSIDLELHLSIQGGKTPYHATAESMFNEMIDFDELYAIVVCGQEIII